MFEIKPLNIDVELKKYLFKREFEIYRLKRDLSELRKVQFELIDKLAVITSELEQQKRDLLGTEDNDSEEDIDAEEDINIDDLLN